MRNNQTHPEYLLTFAEDLKTRVKTLLDTHLQPRITHLSSRDTAFDTRDTTITLTYPDKSTLTLTINEPTDSSVSIDTPLSPWQRTLTTTIAEVPF